MIRLLTNAMPKTEKKQLKPMGTLIAFSVVAGNWVNQLN